MNKSKCEHCGQTIRKINPPEYQIWQAVKARCLNPNTKSFYRYGGRGITICDRWKHSFSNFIADMGPRPSDKHSIDRYPDNNGNYEPGNCRWATAKEQANNKRNSVLVTIGNETKTLKEWSDLSGIPPKTIKLRMSHGIEEDELLRPYGKIKLYKLGDSEYTISQLSTMHGIPYPALRHRLNDLNWDVLDAVTIPLKENKKRKINGNTEVEYKGVVVTLKQLSRLTSLHVVTLIDRMEKGLTGERLVAPGKTLTTYEYKGNRLSLAEIANVSGISATILLSNIHRHRVTAEEAIAMFNGIDLSNDRIISKNLVVLNNRLVSVKELGEELGIHADTLRWRISKGCSLEDLSYRPTKNKTYSYHGQDLTVPQIAELSGVKYATILNRLTKQGMSPEEAGTLIVPRLNQ